LGFEHLDRLSSYEFGDLAGRVVQIAEDACFALASVDTCGNQTMIHTVHAESALAGDLFVWVQEARIIGTCCHAEFAADASLFVN
jgi:hypothetical protein